MNSPAYQAKLEKMMKEWAQAGRRRCSMCGAGDAKTSEKNGRTYQRIIRLVEMGGLPYYACLNCVPEPKKDKFRQKEKLFE